MSLGTVVVLVGLVVLLAWIPLRQHLGFGTILNTMSVGLIANLGLALIPNQDVPRRRASRSSRSRSPASGSAAASTSAPASGRVRATG